ncbi:MAG: glycoside hydrolase family 5 protein, partial [Acetobacteraceae bacterium]
MSTAPGAAAAPAPDRVAVLRRGVNLTNWFRFPASAAPAALGAYLSDAAIDDLRRTGFTVVRLAVQPEFLTASATRLTLLAEEVARLERHGLAVIVALHPHTWTLETHPADRAALLQTWRELAPALAGLDPSRTFPEVLNEPVFHGDEAGWEQLQETARGVIRDALPKNTIVLTGNDWGSIAGLVALHPSPDPDVVYSFHFYDPVELTSLAAWRPGLDRTALARLPFPVSGASTCAAAFAGADPATRDVASYYCR